MVKKLILVATTLLAAYGGMAQTKTTDTTAVLDYADEMPEPPDDMNTYIADHITYPADAHAAGKEGKVIVKFIVDEEGNVRHATVVRGLYRSLDSTAVAVVSGMPKWKPGMQAGKAVKVYFSLPIEFKIDANDTAKVYTHADQMPMPTFSIPDYLNRNLKYPDDAKRARIETTVLVKYVVNEQGKVSSAVVVKPKSPSLDSEAIRVTMGMPLFTPGMNNGKAVKVYYMLPVVFSLQDDSLKKLSDSVYTKVDEFPQFPGLNGYLASSVRYPIEAREANIQGMVIVKFIVDERGLVDSVHVVQSVSKELDEEAVRVIRNMPRWAPGKLNGRPVKVYFTLPIAFKIDDGR